MNIHDIAKMAGVSSATVSRYLNGGYVSQDKRHLIQSIIERTGYVPLLGAQTMRTQRKTLIGVIIPKISSESVSRTVDGISETLSAAGYQILLGNTDNDSEKELDYLSIFRVNTDGVLFLATVFTQEHRRQLKSLCIPIVIIGQQLEGISCAWYDDFGAAKALTNLLLDRGCRRLGFIGVTRKDLAAGLARENGFLAAAQEAHLQVPDANLIRGPFSLESGRTNMRLLLEHCPELDGVFCATDAIAAGAIQELRAAGRAVPRDVAVVGVGDSQFGNILEPTLTTAHFHYRTSGAQAAQMLLDQMRHKVPKTSSLTLGYELVRRESC